MRAKSWSNVLSDLSEDTMALSEALDAHAAETGENNGLYVRDVVTDKRRVKSSIVELPPLRKNNVMIGSVVVYAPHSVPLCIRKLLQAALVRCRATTIFHWLSLPQPLLSFEVARDRLFLCRSCARQSPLF